MPSWPKRLPGTPFPIRIQPSHLDPKEVTVSRPTLHADTTRKIVTLALGMIILALPPTRPALAQCSGGGGESGGYWAPEWGPRVPMSRAAAELTGTAWDPRTEGSGIDAAGVGPLSGAGGNCGDECDDEDCPPDPNGNFAVGDPVLMPYQKFAMVETDFSIEERGVRFVLRRAHVADSSSVVLIDDSMVFRGNSPFGTAWHSTIQMWSISGANTNDHPHYFEAENLRQRVQLGGFYPHDLVNDPNCSIDPGRLTDPNWDATDPNYPGKRGCFIGPGESLDWFRYAGYDNVYNIENEDCAYLRVATGGVLVTRTGMRYYFDQLCDLYDPCDPCTGECKDSFVTFLQRRENRYGQGYDYEYKLLGTPGAGDVQFLVTKVTTPTGRQILFRYDDEGDWPNHVIAVDLADEEGAVLFPNVVEYTYYGPNHPNWPGELESVRRGCDCGGQGATERHYEYVQCTGNWVAGYTYAIAKVKDGQGRTLIENTPMPSIPAFVEEQTVAEDPNITWSFAIYAEDLSRVHSATAPDGCETRFLLDPE